MTLMLMTVEVDVPNREAAHALGTEAGFTVKRVTVPATKAGATTVPSPFQRASGALDMPAGLDKLERKAYLRGYGSACMTYVKKRGIPRGENYSALVEATKAAEWDRHPAAHKKGLTELMKERSHPSRTRGGY